MIHCNIPHTVWYIVTFHRAETETCESETESLKFHISHQCPSVLYFFFPFFLLLQSLHFTSFSVSITNSIDMNIIKLLWHLLCHDPQSRLKTLRFSNNSDRVPSNDLCKLLSLAPLSKTALWLSLCYQCCKCNSVTATSVCNGKHTERESGCNHLN